MKKDEESRIAFQATSPLTNSQHPARIAPGGRKAPRLVEEAPPTIPGPVLPEVPPEIKEIVQSEQPLEIIEPEEEMPGGAEETEQKTP